MCHEVALEELTVGRTLRLDVSKADAQFFLQTALRGERIRSSLNILNDGKSFFVGLYSVGADLEFIIDSGRICHG